MNCIIISPTQQNKGKQITSISNIKPSNKLRYITQFLPRSSLQLKVFSQFNILQVSYFSYISFYLPNIFLPSIW